MNLQSRDAIAALIDHTLLKADAQEDQIRQLCAEASNSHFASVCVNPFWVPLAAELLAGQTAKVCTVIGFPLGASRPSVKLAEARLALADGASELDMVLNVGALRSGHRGGVAAEIQDLAQAAHDAGALLKVILETSLLTDGEKQIACRLAVEARADFVKTSTGFSTGGATEADIRLMRQEVGPDIGVKASGGIRSLASLQAMVQAGATRIGTSSGVAILQELSATGDSVPQPSEGAY